MSKRKRNEEDSESENSEESEESDADVDEDIDDDFLNALDMLTQGQEETKHSAMVNLAIRVGQEMEKEEDPDEVKERVTHDFVPGHPELLELHMEKDPVLRRKVLTTLSMYVDHRTHVKTVKEVLKNAGVTI